MGRMIMRFKLFEILASNPKKRIRIIRRFQLWPVTLGGDTRWLEYVVVAQKVRYSSSYDEWDDVAWIDRIPKREGGDSTEEA
jgi:hypothetical protein